MATKLNKNNIVNFLSRPFPLLDDFWSKLFLVVFCGIFATFFIYYYNPFNMLQMTYDFAIGKVLSIWSAGILGALILSFTQFFLRTKFNLKTFNIGQFLFWVLLEFIFLCIGVYVIFGESHVPFWLEFKTILWYTGSLAFIPYFLACLLIAVFKLSEQLRQEKEIPTISSTQHLFKDENGKIMLAVRLEQILFLKSENNYTSIFYLQNEKVERELIRTNLKKLESELKYPELLRIHRSYMINLQNISSIQRKKGGFQIQLKQLPDLFLKVSDSYKNIFETKIEN